MEFAGESVRSRPSSLPCVALLLIVDDDISAKFRTTTFFEMSCITIARNIRPPQCMIGYLSWTSEQNVSIYI